MVEKALSVEVGEATELLNTNLALNKPLSSSTTISPRNSSSSPVNGDKNTGNYTSFGSGEQWISVDLGDFYIIEQINLWLYFSDGRTYYNKRVQYSEDGVSWVSVYDDTVDPPYAEPSNGSGKTFNFARAGARYVRVITNGSTSNGGNHIVEIEVFLNTPS